MLLPLFHRDRDIHVACTVFQFGWTVGRTPCLTGVHRGIEKNRLITPFLALILTASSIASAGRHEYKWKGMFW